MTSLRRSAALAAVLFLIDAFVMNQGFIALMAMLGVVFVRLPSALLAWKDKALLRNRAARAGIYAGMSVLSAAAILLNNLHAKRQAERIVLACRRYQEKNHRFPDALEELVPDFLPSVPRAKYTTPPWDRFRYHLMPGGKHWLEYTALPPFGRPYYVFEDGRWGYLD